MAPVAYSNDGVHFRADVEAWFPDGKKVNYVSDDIVAMKSPSGDYLLTFQQGDRFSHTIRLYLTKPDNDWRKNVTYSWKLSSAWMSSGSDGGKQATDEWLYWNVENNIDSQIETFNPNSLFSCDLIQLHVLPLDRTPWNRANKDPGMPETRILMTDVLIGANFWNEAAQDILLYRPCPEDTSCQIIDGLIASTGPRLTPHELARLPIIWLGFLAFVVTVILCVWWVLQCIRRAILKRRYEPVAANCDLDMNEEVMR